MLLANLFNSPHSVNIGVAGFTTGYKLESICRAEPDIFGLTGIRLVFREGTFIKPESIKFGGTPEIIAGTTAGSKGSDSSNQAFSSVTHAPATVACPEP